MASDARVLELLEGMAARLEAYEEEQKGRWERLEGRLNHLHNEVQSVKNALANMAANHDDDEQQQQQQEENGEEDGKKQQQAAENPSTATAPATTRKVRRRQKTLVPPSVKKAGAGKAQAAALLAAQHLLPPNGARVRGRASTLDASFKPPTPSGTDEEEEEEVVYYYDDDDDDDDDDNDGEWSEEAARSAMRKRSNAVENKQASLVPDLDRAVRAAQTDRVRVRFQADNRLLFQQAHPTDALDTEGMFQRAESWKKDGSHAAALDVLKDLATMGHARAQCLLGQCYFDGEPELDLELAARWFQLAADAGESDAMVRLAECRLGGWGCDKDEALAVALYEKASASGHPFAAFCLGDLYERGRGGLERNQKKAVDLYVTAAKRGSEDAHEALNRLRRFEWRERRQTFTSGEN